MSKKKKQPLSCTITIAPEVWDEINRQRIEHGEWPMEDFLIFVFAARAEGLRQYRARKLFNEMKED